MNMEMGVGTGTETEMYPSDSEQIGMIDCQPLDTNREEVDTIIKSIQQILDTHDKNFDVELWKRNSEIISEKLKEMETLGVPENHNLTIKARFMHALTRYRVVETDIDVIDTYHLFKNLYDDCKNGYTDDYQKNVELIRNRVKRLESHYVIKNLLGNK